MREVLLINVFNIGYWYLEHHFIISQVTVPAAKQVGLPHWPINCTFDLAKDFFVNVVHDFGRGFIMDFLRPYATNEMDLVNIDTFVRDLLGK